jgi:hypothetical protein
VRVQFGSDRSRQLLHDMGIDHRYDSRSLEFAERLRRDNDDYGLATSTATPAGALPVPAQPRVLRRRPTAVRASPEMLVIELHAAPPIHTGQISRLRGPCQSVAQTLRPYIGPVLFDVVQTRGAVRFAVNHPPACWNIGEGRPQTVLLLVVDQDEKAAIFVVERIDAHRFSSPSSRHEWNSSDHTGGQQGRSGVSANFLM